MGRPTGVTVLGVLAFIGAALSLLAALGMMVGGALLGSMASQPGMQMFAGVGGVMVGAVLIVVAILYVVIGLGMFKLWNWTRVVVIVLSFLGALANAFSLLGALVHFRIIAVLWCLIVIGINVWIAMYLLKPHVKQAFGATGF